MQDKVLLFLPDISGFTKFVNETEIEHGQQIIASLLEEIISSNYLNFNLSEIEGDSVLFYKNDIKPVAEELIELSLHIFNKFHQRRKEIAGATKCNCNACGSIKKLSLKFLIHFGDVKVIKIHNFNKLYGIDVIVIHKLLKNNISESAYILFSNASAIDFTGFNGISGLSEPKIFTQNIDDVGIVEGIYFIFQGNQELLNSNDSTLI